MKKILRCRVTVFLVFGWVALSVTGYMGKDSLYKNYTVDGRYTPYFVLVMQGVHDGIFPWGSEPIDFWEKWGWKGRWPGGEVLAAAGTEDGGKKDAEAEEKSDAAGEGRGDGESGDVTEKNPERAAQEDDVTEKNPENTPEGGQTSGESPENGAGTENEKPEDGEKPGNVTETEEKGQEQKEFVSVDESYFDDAVFIGDSRTVGLHDYSGLTNATFFATVGMNVYDIWTEAFCEADGKKMTLEEALSLRQYKKVYFQIGINEMGRGTVDSFMEAYARTVIKLRELQPDAVLFVQGIMRVAKDKSDTDPIFNNRGINERNARIAALSDNRTIFYIDVNEVVCDEEGNLRSDLTFDGLHLLGSKYGIWVEFLKTRGIALEN